MMQWDGLDVGSRRECLADGGDYKQVDELDMNKTKATELLKAHDGDAVKAMRAFIAVK